MNKIRAFSFLFLIFIFSETTLLLNAQNQNVEQVDWEKIKQAATAYFKYPSSENAMKFYMALPESPSLLNGDVVDFVFKYENFGLLEKQIYASDPNAVKLAFRMINISDGFYTEITETALGNLIRINPRLYLQELSNHRNIGRLEDRSVTMVGELFADRLKARKLEIELRIKALERIKDKNLIEIRNECIKLLKDRRKHFEIHIEEIK
jgi:hypothetical protein